MCLKESEPLKMFHVKFGIIHETETLLQSLQFEKVTRLFF